MQEQAAELQSCRCLGSRQLVAPSCRRSKLRSWDAEPESLTAPPPKKKQKTLLRVVIYDAKAYMDTAVLVTSQSLALVSNCHM